MRIMTYVASLTALLSVGYVVGELFAQTPSTALQPSSQEAPAAHGGAARLFETSDVCLACHNGVTTALGEDISIGFDWRASMMANAARDPYWQAAVRREITDHPQAREAIEDKCSTCHMPIARYSAHLTGGTGEVFGSLPRYGADPQLAADALDGVSCSVCHQIAESNLGSPESFTGGFEVDEHTGSGERTIYGPFEVDDGRVRLMQSASGFRPEESPHIQSSELCASCHTLYTHALDEDGNEVAELPEQVPYLEWLHSDYREDQSCQSCHMPVVQGEAPITSVLGQPRPEVSRHVFRGGNFFMLRMLNRYRNELGVTALPQELDAAAKRTVDHLRTSTARMRVEDARRTGDGLAFDVVVENLAGHKLPTAYPSRRVWLHVRVRDSSGQVVFESGALRPDGSIVGNDADADPDAYEPHHTVVRSAEQVQIYESIMGDASDRPTTGLMSGVRYLKDNRILPAGFDKVTADPDIAVEGTAYDDTDFVGGEDRTRYELSLDGSSEPLTIEASLWYQPIGYRWARNLDDYTDAFEPERFVRYYDDMASGSAVRVVEVETSVGTPR
ncbi:MAG: hypothetical protein U5R14_04215 [Gemmatimonadota bacterium]|nr:hypothetical protein [Gemmatimonadota bacterium]